ncbi:hypothetical protein OHA40_00545 [Nocardia sp. NBC_00508]|uniref:hypothetical protein n=1 Tax=Nocardia sp. NBC_00508 TaxID=2975992 RepID=UPI002E803260|nr:hypothetical protein [Nocardia sp. NBC_00508]WUD66701.1 hypothetical protein OHA40_00545 [Nocardia sp. NBC_00508]
MFKEILTVYGKDTRTRQECQDHIADSHRSLVMSLPNLTKIYRYYSMHRVQNDPVLAAFTPYRYDTEMLIVSPHATESREECIAGMTDPGYLVRAAYEPFVDADRSTSILSNEYVAVDSGHTRNEY